MNNRKLKALHVTGPLDRGGVETWLLQMANSIDRAECEIDVLTHSDREHHYSADFRKAGCRILACSGHKKPWEYWPKFRSLYNQSGPYDIIHSHVHYFSGIVLSLAKALKVPVRIFHAHPVGDFVPPSTIRSLYREAGFLLARRSATHLLACSETTMTTFIQASGFNPPSRAVLYNGVDASRFDKSIDRNAVRAALGLPTDLPLVIYVARFFPHKNHQQVIRVADRINRNGKRVQFALVGSHGPLLPSMAKQCAARNDITLFADIKDVSDLLMASDVFFFPSLEEGFGIVAIEAAAAGLPVLAANWDSIKEACAPGHRNFMFTPDNDDEAVANLERLLADAALRESLSAEGREWVKRFSVESSRDSLLHFYRQAVAETFLTGATAEKPGNRYEQDSGEGEMKDVKQMPNIPTRSLQA